MKRITLFLLVFILLGMQTYALSLKDMIYENKTSASSNKINGTHYYFGGGYSLRFKKNTYAFKPWVNGSAPQFHMGCNGISISGGFISLLGLDDIKNELDNASTAFAWGLIMGIKASLPLVAQVFDTIQAWARAIQKLLQNACKIGQALAQNSQVGQNINHFFNESAANVGFSKVKSTLNDWEHKANWISSQIDNYISGSGNHSQAKALAGKFFTHIHPISLATFYFGKYLPPITSKTKVAEFDDLTDLYNGKLGDLSWTTDDEFERAVLMHKLALLCFGEIGMDKTDYTRITRIINSDGSYDKNKLKQAIFKSLEGTLNNKIVTVPIKPVLSASNVYDFLYKGAKAVKSNACDLSGYCKIPDYEVFYLNAKVESTVDGNKTTNVYKSFSLFNYAHTNGKGETVSLEFQWKGFYQTSLDQIRDAVKVNSGITSYSFIGSAPSTTYSTYSFVLPGMSKYINILALLTKKSGGETQYIYYLEKLLAERNGNTATFLLVNNLASYLKSILNNPEVSLTELQMNELSNYLANVQAVKNDIEKRIEGKLKIDDSVRKLDLMFDQIYKNIKQDNLQNVGF